MNVTKLEFIFLDVYFSLPPGIPNKPNSCSKRGLNKWPVIVVGVAVIVCFVDDHADCGPFQTVIEEAGWPAHLSHLVWEYRLLFVLPAIVDRLGVLAGGYWLSLKMY